MATIDHAVIKRLVGDGPRPTVQVKRIDRDDIKKSLETRSTPKVVKHFNPAAKTAPVPAKKPSGVVAQFEQNPVSNSNQYPYSVIGICFTQSGDSSTYTTGALVGPNMVLTAGNAIPWNNDWTMQFIPAYNDGNAPFGVINVSDVYGYNTNGSTSDDYLVCHLETSVGNEIGWFGAWGSGNGGDYQQPGIDWNSVGYPNQTIQIGVTDFNINNTSTSDNGGSIDLDTNVWITPGWVGGPVWSEYAFPGIDVDDNGPHIAAVVAGGGISINFWGDVNQWQVNEGGTDMVNLVIYGQDNWL